MKLVDGTVTQQVDNHACGRRVYASDLRALRGLNDPRFVVPTTEPLPAPVSLTIDPERSYYLVPEKETVALTPGEGKQIVDAPLVGSDRHGCIDQRRDATTAEELIVRAALKGDELCKPARLDHPGEQLEEPNEVRLPRAVCADQHRDLGEAVDRNVGERAKTADVDRLDGGHRGHRITGRRRSKRRARRAGGRA